MVCYDTFYLYKTVAAPVIWIIFQVNCSVLLLHRCFSALSQKQKCKVAHPCLPVVSVIPMHQIDNLLRHTVEVEDRRVSVKAGGMELVAVLHG